jgi:23S rRNA (adenine2503-C2)-methyltransferase
MACSFCSTGELGLTRNMRMSEILGQILVGRAHLAQAGLPTVRNLVFMGMGEPLMNLAELLRSLETLGSPDPTARVRWWPWAKAWSMSRLVTRYTA